MTCLKKLGPFRLPSLLQDGSVEDFKTFFYSKGEEAFSVLVRGEVAGKEDVLVRVHSACSIAHVFNSQRCDCAEQLRKAMQVIADEGGIIIYAWGHEGRGVGMENHVMAYIAQDKGLDTIDSYIKLGLPVDKRDYSVCAEILKDMKITKVRLLTNSPSKISGMEKYGVRVSERVPLTVKPTINNERQLKAKKEKLGHLL